VNVKVDIRNDAVRRLFAAFEADSDALRQALDPEDRGAALEAAGLGDG